MEFEGQRDIVSAVLREWFRAIMIDGGPVIWVVIHIADGELFTI